MFGVISKKSKSRILIEFFFLSLVLLVANEYFIYSVRGTFIGKLVSVSDELYVLFLFLWTLNLRKRRKQELFATLLVLFGIVGLAGNFFNSSPVKPAFLGLYNTLKPMMLYWCLCQYDFNWDDFYHLMKRFTSFFYIILASYLLDLYTPAFRDYIRYPRLEFRLGIRTLGGLFAKQTNGNAWAIIYYIYYRYYSPKRIHWKYIASAALIFLSVKVKDIFGFLTGVFVEFFKKVRVFYLVVLGPLALVFFYLYMIFMPKHYSSYFGDEEGSSDAARTVLTNTSFKIAKDKFPLGVGYGQFASPMSRDYDSNVYREYHINKVWGLTNTKGAANFMCDTFWPMILGETGVLGLILYLGLLYLAFSPFMRIFFEDTGNRNVLFPSLLFIMYLVMTVAKPVFTGPPHSFILWGFAGIFYSLRKKTFLKHASHSKH